MSKDALPWKDEYALGFQTIDAHHKELVGMINELHASMKAKNGSETSVNILGKLNSYAAKHFQYEERQFEKFKYKESEQHIKFHEEFKAKHTAFMKSYLDKKKIGEGIDGELITFLVNWLLTHIAEEDRKYVECFKQNGLS